MSRKIKNPVVKRPRLTNPRMDYQLENMKNKIKTLEYELEINKPKDVRI